MSDEIKWIKGLEWSQMKVGYCPSIEAFRQEFKDDTIPYLAQGVKRPVASAQWITDHDQLQDYIIVCFNPEFLFKELKGFYSVILHESVHVFDFICEALSLKPCTETRAYMTQWIYDELVENINPDDWIKKEEETNDAEPRPKAKKSRSKRLQQTEKNS